MISKETARKKLVAGYVFAAIGCFIGVYNDVYESSVLSFFIIGYLLWSSYWGFLIVYNPIKEFFSDLITFNPSLLMSFVEHIIKKLIILVIIIVLGIIIGVLGGAVFKQVQLSLIAYK